MALGYLDCMEYSLTARTRQPVPEDTFTYGGDDTKCGRSGLLGGFVTWERNPHDCCCPSSWKATILFVVKKLFYCVDLLTARLGVPHIFGRGGLERQLNADIRYQSGVTRNAYWREQICKALYSIPNGNFGSPTGAFNEASVAEFNPNDMQAYLKLGDEYFQPGQTWLQGEDTAGRKFCAVRVRNIETNRIEIATIHQRYRETCIRGTDIQFDGGNWVMNSTNPGTYPDALSVCANGDNNLILSILERLKNGGEGTLHTLAPKPL